MKNMVWCKQNMRSFVSCKLAPIDKGVYYQLKIIIIAVSR